MKVRSTARMSSEYFVRHFNNRHSQAGELADLAHLDERAVRAEKDRAVWEAYHQRLHKTRGYEHEH